MGFYVRTCLISPSLLDFRLFDCAMLDAAVLQCGFYDEYSKQEEDELYIPLEEMRLFKLWHASASAAVLF